jgi:uncharacterized membrane protein
MSTPFTFTDDGPPKQSEYVYSTPPVPSGERPFLIVSLVGAVLGALFSGVSTNDFISHLDRQVHSIHCSFVPLGAGEIGESGCRTVMMSPYSSLFRESMWGGMPISLLALAVFAYLVMRTSQMVLAKDVTKRETLFLVAATTLPVLMSIIYGYIAMVEIGAVCKLCVGVYVTSALVFGGAVVAHMKAPPSTTHESPNGLYARWFAEGCLYVAVLALFYVIFSPVSEKSLDGCGTLVKKDDPQVLIALGSGKGTRALAVLDPLCPACKAFDERLAASDLYGKLEMQAVLFPLDATCNWMVKDTLHPGACTVSEAMLCQKDDAEEVLDYAFLHQQELLDLGKSSDAKLRAHLEKQFPKIKGCLGSAKIKNLVNKSLRFAVANALPVLTPQLFVGDKRVCDEDTDLGLEFTISKMLEGDAPSGRRRRGAR